MFKIYSKGCEHVLSALSTIPIKEYENNFLAQELCKKAGVSETSTRKGLQLLVHAGILDAVPGPGGGYKFTSHPDNISLLEIIQSVDGQDVFERCIMGLPNCNHHAPCPVHDTWKKVKSELIRELQQKSLGKIMQTAQRRKK